MLSRYVDMYLPLVATRDRHVPLEASRELEACASVPARFRIILRFEGDHRFHSPIYNNTTATDGRTKHIGAEDRAMPPATSCHNQLSIINQQPCSQHIITLHAAGNQQPNQQPPPNRPEVDSYKNSGCVRTKNHIKVLPSSLASSSIILRDQGQHHNKKTKMETVTSAGQNFSYVSISHWWAIEHGN